MHLSNLMFDAAFFIVFVDKYPETAALLMVPNIDNMQLCQHISRVFVIESRGENPL